MKSPNLLLASTIFTFGALTVLSSCHLKNDHSTLQPAPVKDPRYLKRFSTPGEWFCRLAIPYSEKTGDVTTSKTATFVVTGESSDEVKKKLTDDCSEADSVIRGACNDAVTKDQGDNDDYLCVHASEFVPKYADMAKATGHWTCSMDYFYAVEEKIDSKKTAQPKISGTRRVFGEVMNPEVFGEVLAEASPSPSPSVSPSPSPSPAPTSRIVTKKGTVQTDGTTSYATIADAFEKCAAIEDLDQRAACVEQMIGLKMKCYNQDVGPNAVPKRKVTRSRH